MGGYAWRGTLEEEGMPPELVQFFDQSLTFCEARSGGHILCYFIPGPGDAGFERLGRIASRASYWPKRTIPPISLHSRI
jgi:hypothetical protein